MINRQKLENKGVGVIDCNITREDPFILNNYLIRRYRSPRMLMLENANTGEKISWDSPSYITDYCSELLDLEFNSILIGGLGIGVVPYVCQDFAQIDVVENNQGIIDIVTQLGHLNSNVNIINTDFTTFVPSKTYDVILVDIWYQCLSEEQNTEVIDKYLPYVNDGGFLYIPVNAFKGDVTKIKILK